MNVKISGYQKQSKYIEYIVIVTEQSQKWGVWVRYSEFRNLHKILKKKFPSELKQIRLPPKKLIGNFDEDFIEQRRSGLEEYINALLQDEDVAECMEINKLLKPSEPSKLVENDLLENEIEKEKKKQQIKK
ncbi:sorting nexin [Anaeramoeba flamelloides]|uniref:Sorting nexin n=1 Tax=Anaeramoeba flamelloides TaxID=1746091 RepID=A0AAV7YEB4_9EUKA|nr:sorting nexin [Anaeramoeba flamelloides]KAJ6237859.1 sorting nexin [Anaeramoeba flamelloides]